jgi:hydroxymethylbilane synthase
MPYNTIKTIPTIARGSQLSRAQVQEVLLELKNFYPDITFDSLFINTLGDKDKITSLRTLDKTDFFTREIDEWQREKRGFVAIHSAKDLPDPLPSHLMIAAIARGVDSSDSIVFRAHETLESLPKGAKIATSSIHREQRVQALRQDCSFVDIRGTIEERLLQLEQCTIDALVVAEAALIRLQLTHLHRMKLPGETAVGQGQLALVVRKEDYALQELLKPLDVRR